MSSMPGAGPEFYAVHGLGDMGNDLCIASSVDLRNRYKFDEIEIKASDEHRHTECGL